MNTYNKRTKGREFFPLPVSLKPASRTNDNEGRKHKMKLKEHGAILVQYVIDFVNGEISRSSFELDYSGYCIEHCPYFRTEHPRLSARFAETVDATYDACFWMDDERLRDAIADAMDIFFNPGSDLL